MKRIFVALGVIAGVAAVIAAGYFLRFRGEEELPPSGTPAENGGLPLPPIAGGPAPQAPGAGGEVATSTALPAGRTFGAVSDAPVRAFFSDGRSAVSVVRADGTIVRLAGGEPEVLSGSPIPNLSGASFSADGRYALVRFGDGSSYDQWNIFDVEQKTWDPLLQGTSAAVWAPAGSRFAYVRSAGDDQEVVVRDAAALKTAPQVVTRIAWEDPRLAWPAPNDIVVGEGASAFVSGSLLRVDIKAKSARLILSEQLGLTAAWDGAMRRGVTFVASSQRKGGILSIVDGGGAILNRLNFLTLPEKCLFGEAAASSTVATTTPFLLCAVPRDSAGFRREMLPDAYYKKALLTEDDFYRIDLATGAAELLRGTSGESIDAVDLKIVGSTLFFLNRIDGKLYALSSESAS